MALNSRQLGYASLSALSPIFRRLKGGTLRVLAYHDVPDRENYDRQLAFLQQKYTIICLDDLLAAIRGERELPPRAVLITFDDGDYTLYTHALPLHQSLGIPAVVFVITGLVGTDHPYWWKRVEQHFLTTGSTYRKGRDKVAELKSVPNVEREAYLDSLPAYPQRQLTLTELEELGTAGFALANHTHHHPLAHQCTPAELTGEVRAAQRFLDPLKHGYGNVFAYPNGNSSKMSRQVLREAGIEVAFAFDHRLTDLRADRLNLSRIRVNTTDPIAEFRAKVDGLHPFIHHLAKG